MRVLGGEAVCRVLFLCLDLSKIIGFLFLVDFSASGPSYSKVTFLLFMAQTWVLDFRQVMSSICDAGIL